MNSFYPPPDLNRNQREATGAPLAKRTTCFFSFFSVKFDSHVCMYNDVTDKSLGTYFTGIPRILAPDLPFRPPLTHAGAHDQPTSSNV